MTSFIFNQKSKRVWQSSIIILFFFLFAHGAFAWWTTTTIKVTLTSPTSGSYSLPTVSYSATVDMTKAPTTSTGWRGSYTLNYVCIFIYLDRATYTTGSTGLSVARGCGSIPSTYRAVGYNTTFTTTIGFHTLGTFVEMGQSDGAGGMLIDSLTVQDFTPVAFTVVATIPNTAPTATILMPVTNPYTSSLGTAVTFYGTGTDPDTGDYITANDWRDGACGAGTLLSSSYIFSKSDLSLGSHNIYFRAKDSHNAWSSCAMTTVNVTALPASCSLPWGGSLASGNSVTAYYNSSVVSPATCTSQTRTCTNGTLSGSYTNQGCTVTYPAPTASASVSQNPVPYSGNPSFTLSSTNAYYCYLLVDWATYLVNGYTTSGTYNYGAFNTPGAHTISAYCYNSVWQGSGWSTTNFTVNSPPTSSLSVSPNPVPYNSAPSFTLSSTNAYYCHVLMDGVWTWNVSGYFGSGTYSPGALTSPGAHSAWSYCYNSVWVNPNGWSITNFTVSSPPTASVSVSPNPVPYGGNPGFTLSSTNGYYSYILMDGIWNWYVGGYFTSGTYYPGALTSPGAHSAWAYTYNPAWIGSGWSTTPFTVNPPPTSSVSISQNPVPYGGNPGFTLSSTNGYYCYVQVDGANVPGSPGYFTSGTFYHGAFTNPGAHTVSSYCYNSAWNGSGWSTTNFTVNSAPVNGSCGTANSKTYTYGSSSYSPYTQCSSGSSSNTAFPSAGSSISWTCSGANSGSASPTCSARQNAAASCTLPWGNVIASGVSVTAFQVPSVISPAACPASQTRTCNNGTLSGSYTNSNCVVLQPIATISANPTRVRSVPPGNTSTISWTLSNTSCTAKRNGISWNPGPSFSSTNSYLDTLTGQTTYTITCTNIATPQSVTVNVLAGFQEF